jgi:hypothetical protein
MHEASLSYVSSFWGLDGLVAAEYMLEDIRARQDERLSPHDLITPGA